MGSCRWRRRGTWAVGGRQAAWPGAGATLVDVKTSSLCRSMVSSGKLMVLPSNVLGAVMVDGCCLQPRVGGNRSLVLGVLGECKVDISGFSRSPITGFVSGKVMSLSIVSSSFLLLL